MYLCERLLFLVNVIVDLSNTEARGRGCLVVTGGGGVPLDIFPPGPLTGFVEEKKRSPSPFISFKIK